jgi:DNA-directed RNA polymerase alpha subunit
MKAKKYPSGLDDDPVCRFWFDQGASTRTAHCLRNFGIATVETLADMDWNAFSRFPNVGPLVLRECASIASVSLEDVMRPLRLWDADKMARELQRRGWTVTPPAPPTK